jgi:Fe-S cluster assembly protein SufD
MTTAAPSKTIASYARDFDELRKALNGEGSQWLASLREQAWEEFERLGFPATRRGNELWKYTDLRRLNSEAFSSVSAAQISKITAETIREQSPWSDDWHTAVTVDGRFIPELSRNLSGEGLDVSELAQSADSDQESIRPVFGSLAQFEANPFVALNTALFETCVLIRVSEDAEIEQPVHLLNLVTDGADNRAFYPRTLLIAGVNSNVTVIESFVNLSAGPQLTVPVFEIALESGSQVRHFRVQLENEKSVHIGATRVDLPANATFNSTTFATGPAIGRNDIHTRLSGEGAMCTLHGLYITNGKSHQDNEISTTHEKPHGTSHQYYKGILAGKSRAVFSGKVLVQPGAMKTVAMQKDLNLLLSHGVEIDTKPSLEIYADDVKCAHGATAGHVDPNMLFYLLSRGVSHDDAANMLITGFASEIVDEFEPELLRGFLYRKFERLVPELETEGIL